MIWYDMIWYDLIWYDMGWCDMIWFDALRYDMTWYEMIWYHMIWYDMVWYDMIWYDMIWYDMIWYDMMNTISFQCFWLPMELCSFTYVYLFVSKQKQTCPCEGYNCCNFVRARDHSWLNFNRDLESSFHLEHFPVSLNSFNFKICRLSLLFSCEFISGYKKDNFVETENIVFVKIVRNVINFIENCVEGVIRSIENHRVFPIVKSTNLLYNLWLFLDVGVWGDWKLWCKIQFVFSPEQHVQCCHYHRMSVLYGQAADTLGECCLLWW